MQRSAALRVAGRLAIVAFAASVLFALAGWQIALVAVVLAVPLFDLDPWPIVASGLVWLAATWWSRLSGNDVGLSPVTGIALLAVAAWPAASRDRAVTFLGDLGAWGRQHPVRAAFSVLASATAVAVIAFGGTTATATALGLAIVALAFGMDGRWAIGLGLVFLACAPLLLSLNRAAVADEAATSAYYFFVLGTALMIRRQIASALQPSRGEGDERVGPEA